MINGAIDYVQQLPSGQVKIAGWAVQETEMGRRPVAGFTIIDRPVYEFFAVDRPDISSEDSCGFTVELKSATELAALVWGEIKLIVFTPTESISLAFWTHLEASIKKIIEDHILSRCLFDRQPQLSTSKRSSIEVRGSTLSTSNSREIGNLSVVVGGQSTDANVIVGKEGCLFLLGGTNDVVTLYNAPADKSVVEKWTTLIEHRAAALKIKGIDFLQMIVPEKQSVTPEMFPINISTPTSLLREIAVEMRGRKEYIDCFNVLRRLFLSGINPFLKVDTHLSYFGTEAIVRELIERIGLNSDIFAGQFYDEITEGDIGRQLFNGSIVERSLKPCIEDWHFANSNPLLVNSVIPAEGHGGTIMEWEAKEPISEKRVLIFGNSMFERGGAPLGLSWWTARIFKASRFIWSSHCIEQHIDEFRPDLVIAQTVERFLMTVPVS